MLESCTIEIVVAEDTGSLSRHSAPHTSKNPQKHIRRFDLANTWEFLPRPVSGAMNVAADKESHAGVSIPTFAGGTRPGSSPRGLAALLSGERRALARDAGSPPRWRDGPRARA